MRTHRKSAAPHQRVRSGFYTHRQLERAGLRDWAAATMAVTLRLRDEARAWEDADVEAFAASADRDRADEVLDTTAQNTRANLAGRSKNANKEKPYTQIFPDGVSWYTLAPVDEQVSRYTLFAERLRMFLPENDPMLGAAVQVDEGINQYKAGVSTLTQARQKLTLQAQKVEDAEDAFDRHQLKLFGLLLEHFADKAVAERFFSVG